MPGKQTKRIRITCGRNRQNIINAKVECDSHVQEWPLAYETAHKTNRNEKL